MENQELAILIELRKNMDAAEKAELFPEEILENYSLTDRVIWEFHIRLQDNPGVVIVSGLGFSLFLVNQVYRLIF